MTRIENIFSSCFLNKPVKIKFEGKQLAMKDKCIKSIPTQVYAGRTKNKEILLKSSSGGAFTVLSDKFLAEGSSIVCAVYNYNTKTTEYIMVFDKDKRNLACGSKYMQSKPGVVFRQAHSWLKEHPDKKLLFFGMGCQTDGFRKYAEEAGIRDRVWVVDIICHGLPSPRIWREYAESLEKKYNGTMSELSFKDKRNGWMAPTAKTVINGNEILLKDYVKIFYNRCTLRPSCHECPFAITERKTDITIGDFWHIEEKMPDFYDPNGTSLFLIHTDRGRQLFESIEDLLYYRESNTTDCWQANLEKPTSISPQREEFWNDYQAKGIDYIMKKYATVSMQARIKNKLKKIWG